MYFKLLQKEQCKGTDYVEFFVGDRKEPSPWNANAFFLKSSIFGCFFIDCFPNFMTVCDPPKKYWDKELLYISDQLQKLIGDLSEIQSFVEFESFVNKKQNYSLEFDYEDSAWRADWKKRLDDIKKIAASLSSIIRNAFKTEKILWVLGV